MADLVKFAVTRNTQAGGVALPARDEPYDLERELAAKLEKANKGYFYEAPKVEKTEPEQDEVPPPPPDTAKIDKGDSKPTRKRKTTKIERKD